MGYNQVQILSQGDSEILQLRVKSDSARVGDVTGAILQSVGHLRPSEDLLAAVEIVLSEVINNIIEHAYLDKPDGIIDISVVENKNGVGFHFYDQGLGMPGDVLPTGKLPNSNCAIPELPEGGFGWFLIYSLTDNLQYVRENGRNHLSFQLELDDSKADL